MANQRMTSLTMAEQDRYIAEAMERDEPRLRRFIRRRVLDAADAEDVLQDVFYELIAAYRMLKPAEQVLLGKILFGGFHKHAYGRRGWGRHMEERWGTMTPEERERFRAGMRGRRCGFGREERTANEGGGEG